MSASVRTGPLALEAHRECHLKAFYSNRKESHCGKLLLLRGCEFGIGAKIVPRAGEAKRVLAKRAAASVCAASLMTIGGANRLAATCIGMDVE